MLSSCVLSFRGEAKVEFILLASYLALFFLLSLNKNFSYIILHLLVQSQEEEAKMILSMFWKVIMTQFVKEINLFWGENDGLRKQALIT